MKKINFGSELAKAATLVRNLKNNPTAKDRDTLVRIRREVIVPTVRNPGGVDSTTLKALQAMQTLVSSVLLNTRKLGATPPPPVPKKGEEPRDTKFMTKEDILGVLKKQAQEDEPAEEISPATGETIIEAGESMIVSAEDLVGQATTFAGINLQDNVMVQVTKALKQNDTAAEFLTKLDITFRQLIKRKESEISALTSKAKAKGVKLGKYNVHKAATVCASLEAPEAPENPETVIAAVTQVLSITLEAGSATIVRRLVRANDAFARLISLLHASYVATLAGKNRQLEFLREAIAQIEKNQ